MQRVHFSVGKPPRSVELRLSGWGLEEYYVDEACVARRWNLAGEGQKEIEVAGSVVLIELAKSGGVQLVRAFADGAPIHSSTLAATPRSRWRVLMRRPWPELAITLAIIGVLTAVAERPAEKSYGMLVTIRQELKRFEEVKPRIAEFRAAKGAWPARNEDVGIAADGLLPEGNYPFELYADGGVTMRLSVRCSSGADCRSGWRELGLLSLRPAVDRRGDIVWICGDAKVPSGYDTPARNRTTAPWHVRPRNCD